MPNPNEDKVLDELAESHIDEDKIAEKAKEIATKEVESLKENLISSLGGKQEENEWGWSGKDPVTGKPAPKDWNEAPQKILEKAIAEAEARMERKLTEKEKEVEKTKLEAEKKQQEMEQSKAQEEYARMSAEWRRLVDDGDLPDIDQKIKDKLKTAKYEDLTDEEKADKGLKTWNELRMLHADLYKKGESPSLTYTVQKKWKKKPAGHDAPVFGDDVGSMGSDSEDEYTHEDVKAMRKKMFGW